MPSTTLTASLLATRGERVALFHIRLEVAGDVVGPSEIEHLNVNEVNASGAPVALVRFDAGDLDAAYAELDARFAAGEARIHARVAASLKSFVHAWSNRDWDALAAKLSPDLVTHDHRLLGWGALQGKDAYLQAQKALVELAPDTSVRTHHLRLSKHGYLFDSVAAGIRDGGPFELPNTQAVEVDQQDRVSRFDIYDTSDVEQAIARFESLGASAALARFEELKPDALQIPPNAATRAQARYARARDARDWTAVRALVSDDFRFEDRGRRALVEGDVETFMKSLLFAASQPGVRFEHEPLATLGERILVEKMIWRGEAEGAEFLTDRMRLVEVDAGGQFRRVILFDLDDRAAAFAEGLERFAAGEAAGADGPAAYAAFVRCLDARDWDAMRESLSPDFVFDDHRPLSLGILSGQDWVASLRVRCEMAPDLASEVSRVLAWNPHGFVVALRIYGTLRDGGPFENVFLVVFLAAGNRLVRVEPYPIEQHDKAIARMEELTGNPRSIAANAATRTSTRTIQVFLASDWDGVRTLARADFHYEDRSRRALVTGDVETWIASMRFFAGQPGIRVEHELVATIGDSIELRRLVFSGGIDGADFEIPRLRLLEVDAEGKVQTVLFFDLEDGAAARTEAQTRFTNGEAVGLAAEARSQALARFGELCAALDADDVRVSSA